MHIPSRFGWLGRSVAGLFIWLLVGERALAYDNIIQVPNHYPTIQEAVNHAKPGQWIFVRPGVYNEVVSVNNKKLLIYGHPGEHPTIRGGFVMEGTENSIHEVDIVVVDDAPAIVVDGGYGGLIRDTVLRNNIIYPASDNSGAGNGIFLKSCDRCQVIGNYIDGFSGSGLYLDGDSAGTLVKGNTISHNGTGISLAARSKFFQVMNNDVMHNEACDIENKGQQNLLRRNDASRICGK